jgi:hypothetical protein
MLVGLATLGLGLNTLTAQASALPSEQPPVVNTGQASGVAQGSATLTGTVATQGFETLYEFDLGVDTSYGTRIFGDAGVELGTQTFMFALQGLAPGATYHYRIAATNIFGTSYGTDQTFTTASYPTATFAAPVTPPLVPAVLLVASEPGASTAKVASVGSAARAAQDGGAGRRSKGSHGKKRKGRPGKAGHAHGPNKRGGK